MNPETSHEAAEVPMKAVAPLNAPLTFTRAVLDPQPDTSMRVVAPDQEAAPLPKVVNLPYTLILLLLIIFRIFSLLSSTIYMFPIESTAIPRGRLN